MASCGARILGWSVARSWEKDQVCGQHLGSAEDLRIRNMGSYIHRERGLKGQASVECSRKSDNREIRMVLTERL